jgi:CBS domain-containing protein
MNQSLSVGDIMRREYVGVNEGDAVAGVATLMHEEAVEGVLVLRGSDPVGIVTASDVVAVVARGADPAETDAGAIMRSPVITVDPEDDLAEAVGAFADRDVRWLAVTSADDVVGVVSEHDVLTAPTGLSTGGAVGGASAPESGGVGRHEDVGLQSATYATQGVCEVCGALSRTLESHNGQLLCEDCQAM